MRRLEWTYFLVVALRWLPVGLSFPLRVLAEQDRGLSLAQVGLVGAVYSVTVLVLEVPTGGLADVLGRRRVLLAGTVTNIVALLVFLFATSLAAFALAALLRGIERALRSGALEAWFVDAALAIDPEANLTRGLSRGGIADGGGLAVGALAAGLLPLAARWLPGGASAPLSQLTLPIAVAAVVEVALIVALVALVREPPVRRARAGQGLLDLSRAGVRLAGTPALRRLLLAMVALGFTITALELLAAPRVADLLGGTERTEVFGLLWAGGFLAAACGSAFTPALARLFGGRVGRAALAGRAAEGAVMLALGAVSALVPTVGLYGLAYLVGGVVHPLHEELLHRNVPSGQRATMLSVSSLCLMAGGAVGSLALPAVADGAGIGAAWLAGGVLLTVSALLYRPFARDRDLELAR